MYVRRNIKWGIVFRFAWVNILIFATWSSLIVYVFHHFEHHGTSIAIPFLPLSTIGVAVAFYLGFKNNASYDRFWEARKIWGAIINYSRTWGNQVMCFVTKHHAKGDISKTELFEIRKKLIYRHLAWINALRLQLRQPTSFSIKHPKTVSSFSKGSTERKEWDGAVRCYLGEDEFKSLIERRNTATFIIRRQGEHLRELMEEKGLIEDFRHMEMMRVLEEFYNFQGKCERIKNTPFPRQYAFFGKVFTWIFILLFPIGLIGEFSKIGHNFIWLTVPFSILVSWIFVTMEVVGDNSEDPFENFVNDVPMTALCRVIEIDLMEMAGVKDLPESVKPVNDILF